MGAIQTHCAMFLLIRCSLLCSTVNCTWVRSEGLGTCSHRCALLYISCFSDVFSES